ncbi:hypothetical protein HBI81_203320 [Parastagonospora nodorum]|nr:hypothetical protein HBI81_203320 [Parastagonospora nodorum]
MTSIVAVRAALKSSDSEHASMFASLLEENKFIPYKSRGYSKRRLGVDYARLGKKQVPSGLRGSHSPKTLHDMCLRDLPHAREKFGAQLTYFSQPGWSSTLEDGDQEATGMQTINTLIDADAGDTTTIVTFPSETLEKMCAEDWESPQNTLRTTMTTCTVLPKDTLLPLHHSNEGTTITTLLTGTIVWIIWPPTAKNMRGLQTMYEIMRERGDEKPNLTFLFEGGMVLVQNEGDGLRIPAHSIMMALATSTSVLAAYSEVTVENFTATLEKMPMLRAWFQTEIDGNRKQVEFFASVLRQLDLLLNGNPEGEDSENPETMVSDEVKLPRTEGGLLDTLLLTWDRAKGDVAAMMGPADQKSMEDIWEEFLIDCMGQECRICGEHVQNNEKLMKQHFIASHWSAVQETKQDDSVEMLGKNEGDAKTAEQVEEVEGDCDLGDTTMHEGDAIDLAALDLS